MNTPDMTCLINKTTRHYLAKGKKIEVIARYLKMKYKINMDISLLRKRAAISNDLIPLTVS